MLPTGFEIYDEATGEEMVCLLLGSLKGSARCWYTKIDGFLISKGYNRLESDYSVYVAEDGSIVSVYVDDIIVENDQIKA